MDRSDERRPDQHVPTRIGHGPDASRLPESGPRVPGAQGDLQLQLANHVSAVFRIGGII